MGKHKRLIITSLILLGTIVSVSGIFYGIHHKEINEILSDVSQKKQNISDSTFKRTGYTVIYDKNKNVLARLISNQYIYAPDKDISNYAKEAFIATEDKDFYKHGAISYKGTFRAFVQIIKHNGYLVQGGSTITQQLVKNVFLSNKKTLERKIEEILLARDIAKKYSKDQILDYYLNNIYFGRGNYGIETAAEQYFQKDVKDLTLSETAFLASIPNNPSEYDPILNKSNTLKRRNLILYNMLEQDYINKNQYNSAVKEEIVLNPKSNPAPKDSYAVSYAIYNATKDLMAYDGFNFRYTFKSDADKEKYQKLYSRTYSDYEKRVRAGGYKIYTSIDPKKQLQLQESVDSKLSGFTGKDPNTKKYQVQGAAVSIDNSTGYVEAVVGGRSGDDEFNRAFLSYRQPGSAIKPVLVYTPAFDNKYHPLSRVVDQYIPNGPVNDEHKYFGSVTLRYATEVSLNTIPYILMTRLGADKLMRYLLNMHFSGVEKEDYNSIAAIGGFTKGVSPVEMAGAYSALEHNGQFADSTCVKSMVYQDGSRIFKDQEFLPRKKVYTPESSYMMTDILKGVFSKDYATGHNLKLAGGHIAAGKTGTTSDNKDGWFCGYTKYYTTVVWVGADMPQEVNNLYGAVYPGAIWKDYMDKIHIGLSPEDFSKPSTIVYKNINPDTGELVSYNSGVKDMFSKPILDKIAEDERKAEAQARAKQESDYREAEPKREKQIEKLLEQYESEIYSSVDSLETIDGLRDKISHLISQILDVDKANVYKDRLDKRTAKLKSNRDKWKKIKEQNIKNAQLQIDASKAKENASNAEIGKINKQKELLEQQAELQREKENQQDRQSAEDKEEKSNEEAAAKAVQRVQAFSNNTAKNNSNFTNVLNDAYQKIGKVNDSMISETLIQAVKDKVSLLK